MRPIGITTLLFAASFADGATLIGADRVTGNVTSAALDIADILWTRPRDADTLLKLHPNLAGILVFLVGCLSGGFLSWHFGVITVLLPGGLVLSYFSYIRPTKVVV